MGYPKRLLNEDEDVVFDLHPHWKALIRPTLLAPVIVFVATYGAGKVPDDWSAQSWIRIVIGAVAAALFIVFTIAPYVKWLTTHFVLTNRRVLMREGLIARKGRDIPIFRINDVTFEHTVIERLLGCGTLVVESAGERGQVSLTDIPHVEDVQPAIYTLIDDDDARRRGGPAGDPDIGG